MTLLLFWACTASDALPYGSTSEDCAGCHVEEAEAWAQSGHGTSGDSPILAALRPLVEDSWGERSRKLCDGCHTPGWGGDPTIGCVSCHAAVGNHGAHDGRTDVDLDEPLSGPLGDAAVPTSAHTSTTRSYLDDAELCGTCHEVTGPHLFVETTYSEYLDADVGQTCVDCHAPRIADGAWTDGTPVRTRHDHRFAAMSPAWGADAGTAATFDAASATLLGTGLTLRVDGDEVVLTNTGAGHTVPTGVSFLRSVRVEVEQGGVVVDTPIELGADLVAAGELVPLVTDADEVRPHGLAPGESRAAALPTGPGTACLRVRALREDVEAALGIDAGLELRTVVCVDFE